MMTPEIGIRPMEPADRDFIFATWLRCYQQESRYSRRISRDVFFREHHAILERLLGSSSVLIAHLADSPGVIIGYLVSQEPNVAHFAYVKKPFRKMGIARLLLAASPIADSLESLIVSHSTEDWESFLSQKLPGATFNPYEAQRG